MIFSNYIYKIESGLNPSAIINNNKIYISFYNKSLNLYSFLINNLSKCVFVKNYNYHNFIKINNNKSCICYNDEMRIVSNEDI